MLVTFDIWDTLLRRRCHPDEVKLFTCRAALLRAGGTHGMTAREVLALRVECEREIGREAMRSGLDDEYALRDVLRRTLDRLFDRLSRAESVNGAGQNGVRPGARALDRIADELSALEFEQEKYVSYADRLGGAMLRASGRPVVAVTDFYMSAGRMRALLERHFPGVPVARVYSSCDLGLNKRSGRLFNLVRKDHAVTPDRHTHIGNSEWSDVRPCERAGGRAVWFKSERDDRGASEHERRFDHRLGTPGLDGSTRQLLNSVLRRSCAPPTGLTPEQRGLYECGYAFAPVYAGLVLLACEEAIRRRCPRVHYLTREGELFAAVHRAMAPVQPLGLPMPQAELLEVSRVATFFPSLREFTPAELMRIWNMYSRQSPAQAWKTMGLLGFSLEPWVRRHGLDPDEPITQPWRDQRVRALFADRDVQRMLKRWQARRREAAVGYMKSRGLGERPALLVDIGWRGTIQDNIACLFPKIHVAGVYLGLLRLLNQQPANSSKSAFGPDARRCASGADPARTLGILRWVAPFEMVSNTGTGSVIGYRKSTTAGGGFEAVREDNPQENAVHERFIRHFQRGVLDAAPVVADWIRTFAVTSDEMRAHCLELMERLSVAPPPAVADAFFSLTHNETFGVGGFVEKRAEPPAELLAHANETGDRGARAWRSLCAHAEESTWPEGYFIRLRREDLALRYARENSEAVRGSAGDQELAGVRALSDAAALRELHSSAAYRWSVRFKDLPAYRAYAKARWGLRWSEPPALEPAEAQMARVRRGRVYRTLAAIGRGPVVRAYRRLERAADNT